jgi:hypothetical protein
MRLMSFRLTTDQFLNGTKDVTRRLGWRNLKIGEHFMAVKQAQGLRKGEKVKQLGECVCLSNIPEPLFEVVRNPRRPPTPETRREMDREGFPDLSAYQFVEMFCKEMKCTSYTIVNRIEFKRI